MVNKVKKRKPGQTKINYGYDLNGDVFRIDKPKKKNLLP